MYLFWEHCFFLTKRTSVYEFFNKKSEKVLKVNHKRGSSTCGFKTDAESINFAPYFLCYRSVGCLQGLCSLATEPEPSPAATSMTSGTVILIKKKIGLEEKNDGWLMRPPQTVHFYFIYFLLFLMLSNKD